jgi:hypothetical protein
MNARRYVIVAAFAGYLASPAEDDATAKAGYEAGKATTRAEGGLTQSTLGAGGPRMIVAMALSGRRASCG